MSTMRPSHMHPRIPRHLPTWAQMLDSLGNPPAAAISKWIGVSERTVFNYGRAGQAPRAAMLALFWLTPWGDSALNTDRENLVRVLQSLSKAQGLEVATLRQRIAYLETVGGFGSANDPLASDALHPLREYAR